MTRCNLFRAAKRFPPITTNLREPEDPSAAGTAIDSTNSLEDRITSAFSSAYTRWNSIALFFADDTGAQQVILVPANGEMHDLDAVIASLNLRIIPYVVVPQIHNFPLARLGTQIVLCSDAVRLRVRSGLVLPFSQVIKRLFDILAARILIGLLSPLCVIVLLVIALDGGPIFFAHERVGRGGRVFKGLKFRTTAPDTTKALKQVMAWARAECSRARKVKNDPRTTRIGSLLRVSGTDAHAITSPKNEAMYFHQAEIVDASPQFISVLRGDMSLVGPSLVVQQELREHFNFAQKEQLL
jgi:lipopolysaccharide/colanic/teichoic acid biosynthesis glycosyltransferase